MTHKAHKHSSSCGHSCSREWDIDVESQTGSYRIVAKKQYGHRGGAEKPRWWPFAFHAYKALIQLAGLVGIAWLAKKLGLTIPNP